MAREINLVPDIKDEMIKTLKMRNFIFFLCIIVASVSVVFTIIVGLIVGGQQMAIDSKKTTIETLSSKLNSYSDLSDFLTIKDQLGNISTLTGDKKVLSRTFNILSTLLPTGPDTITVSELSVNLAADQPTFSFDAQANAGTEPYYDYRVLDAFKKSMQYMRYDYGNYVDEKGNVIPAYCMIEKGSDGAMFNDADKGIYAYWDITGEGCLPKGEDDESTLISNYSTTSYDGRRVVQIWRTPQVAEWYHENPVEGQPNMTTDGVITGVPHFESRCINYSVKPQASGIPKLDSSDNSCKLVPAGSEGIKTPDTSNGRGASDELVLRFSATIYLAPEVYQFNNTHMMAIGPSGRHNVTDSYVQIQAMFGERATDCDENDTACKTNGDN